MTSQRIKVRAEVVNENASPHAVPGPYAHDGAQERGLIFGHWPGGHPTSPTLPEVPPMSHSLILMGAILGALPQIGTETLSARPATGTPAGPRLALLVGVSRYSNFPSLGLPGPANDVILMHQVLRHRLGFQEKNIVTLSEAEGAKEAARFPTRANIEREMVALANKVAGQSKARLVVYLSGHGTRQPDLLRAPGDVKPDGMSEVFLPSDFGAWDPAGKRLKNSIIDFELREWLKLIRGRGARVWVIVDSCYSGSIARGLTVPRVVDIRDPSLRLGPPPAAYEEASRRGKANAGRAMPPRAPLDEPGLVALYASLPNETTFEDLFPYYSKDQKEVPKKYGVLTWHVGEVFNDVLSDPDMTFREMVRRIQAKYRRLGIDHPTPLVEGLDLNEQVLWSGAGSRVTRLYLTRLPNGTLKVSAGRLHGLTESSILAVYPPTGPTKPRTLMGHVVLTRAGATESDVAVWDEAKAADSLKGRYKAPPRELEGGERCEPVLLAYGDLKLKLTVAANDGEGREIAPEARRRVREALAQLSPEAEQYISVVEDGERAQWLLRPADGDSLELVRREGMEAGPLMVPRNPRDLYKRLVNISRAQMLMQFETGDSPPEKAAVEAGEAIAFDIELLRQAAGEGEFRPVALVSGEGPAFRVGDRLQLKFTNKGKLDVDVTVFQIDQNYDIFPMFPPPAGGVLNRLSAPNEIQRNVQPLVTARPRVTGDGVTPFKDANGDQRGLHSFVIMAVEGMGDPVNFLDLWTNPKALQNRAAHRGVQRARPFLDALRGQGDSRAGLGMRTDCTYVVRVIRWEILKPSAGQ